MAVRDGTEGLRFSREKLAELVGLSPRWIQKIENGQSNPNWFHLPEMMAVLELEPADLVREVGMDVPVSAY